MSLLDFRRSCYCLVDRLTSQLIWFSTEESSSYPANVSKWKEGMQQAYALASKSVHDTAWKGKPQIDRRMRSTALAPGDRLLVRKLTPRGGPGKIRAYWEDEINVVA